jgi:hypothetical protein
MITRNDTSSLRRLGEHGRGMRARGVILEESMGGRARTGAIPAQAKGLDLERTSLLLEAAVGKGRGMRSETGARRGHVARAECASHALEREALLAQPTEVTDDLGILGDGPCRRGRLAQGEGVALAERRLRRERRGDRE